ncbi:MAG: NADPH:quinone oxidoreductase family protein [Burkholderiales bacterium]|nr:NADPH:quinone oxidoreductase family protein [Burkholderiales bacterium]
MRAVELSEWTAPAQLRPATIPDPAPGAGEVLIRVHASAVSHSLALLVQGKYQRRPAFPFVPGITAAGCVCALGAGVTRFRPGDRVLASIEHGGLAELAVASVANTYSIAPGMSYAAATTLNTSYNSVAAALTWPHLLALGAGASLLVTGAAGNAGTAAIQIGRLLGARVIAAAASAAKREFALAQGATAAIDADPARLRAGVRAALGGGGVSAVLETVGGEVFDAALRCLAPEGRIVPLGFASGVIPRIPANLLLVKNVTVCGLYMGYYKIDARAHNEVRVRALFERLGEWWSAGAIKPVIRAVVPLEDIAAAFALVLERANIGHVVVSMPAQS